METAPQGRCEPSSHAVSGTPHAPRVSLICIGDFPGVERFIGLGQLRADQLATLVDRRQPVVAEQYAAASAAWRAFRDPDPSALVALSRRPVDALPFLRDALLRFLAEYPSTTNGLGHTEQLILDTLDEGPLTGIALFSRAQRREPRPFMGDGCFLDRIRRMADARVPLVTIEPGGDGVDLRTRTIATTAAGRDVCHSRQDAVRLNGIDTWRGGVRLRGAEAPWRWDPAAETLVSWVPPRGHDAAAEQ